ncbi:DHH family phosphoesterase [Methanomassiliicoccales archaeon LGM-DZ1]|nr:DHH family phosphoesterase [Methanomassiliicoccales archaeon LGM-DZ1]
MEGFDLPSKLLSALRAAADTVRGHDFIQCYSHFDADGITAAAIISKALLREGKEFRMTIFPTLNEEQMKTIEETPSECVLITDLGASYIKRFDALPCDAVVLDHHTVKDQAEKAVYANPHLYGIDGMTSGCGATMAFLFAVTLDESNWDLAPLALAGMAGDRQHINGLSGLNAFVLSGAEQRGLAEERPGSLIPPGKLSESLYLSTDPYIRGVSGSETGTAALLADAGISGDRSQADLTEEEKDRLSSLIALKLISQGVTREKLEELARTRYWLPGWRTDAESLSGVLNAAGRSGEAGLGVAAGMGDAESLKAAEEIDRASSRELLEAVLAVDREGLVQMENIQWFDSSVVGFTGMVCGTAMSYFADPSKPTVGVNTSDPKANASSRATFSLLDAGVDLAEAMSEAARAAGGEGGGHKIAAGGSFPSERVQDFLRAADEAVGRQKKTKN